MQRHEKSENPWKRAKTQITCAILAASLAACTHLNLPTAEPNVATPPTVAATTSGQAVQETSHDLIPGIPRNLSQGVQNALKTAGANRGEWEAALRDAPADQRPGLAYLLANMPEHDLRELKKNFLLEHVSLAYAARAAAPWGKEMPEEIFQEALLPYANVNENRDPWRKEFAARFGPMVADCKTAAEAALVLNAKIFKDVKVEYHPTKRPKPDQSPAESMAAGYASCTGLSILLIDACRSVGVPARIVGTPLWTVPKGDANGNHAGNHMWVEIWDGQWHVLGASEVSKLDETWFLENASHAVEGKDAQLEGIFAHRIYAATLKKTGITFPLVWKLEDKEVRAEDVTMAYADRIAVKVELSGAPEGEVELRQEGRLVALVRVRGTTTLVLSAGQSYDATVRVGDHVSRQILTVPREKTPVVTLRLK